MHLNVKGVFELYLKLGDRADLAGNLRVIEGLREQALALNLEFPVADSFRLEQQLRLFDDIQVRRRVSDLHGGRVESRNLDFRGADREVQGVRELVPHLDRLGGVVIQGYHPGGELPEVSFHQRESLRRTGFGDQSEVVPDLAKLFVDDAYLAPGNPDSTGRVQYLVVLGLQGLQLEELVAQEAFSLDGNLVDGCLLHRVGEGDLERHCLADLAAEVQFLLAHRSLHVDAHCVPNEPDVSKEIGFYLLGSSFS